MGRSFEIIQPLWKHQTETLQIATPVLNERGYFWLLAGCSTGKTLTALAIAASLKCSSILVITKIAAFYTAWYSDITEKTEGLKPIILDKGSAEDKAKLLTAAPKGSIIVVNYETAKLIAEVIRLKEFDMIVADESHKLKSHNSAISLDLAYACNTAKYRIGLTATGFDDSPTDAYGQVRWFDPIIKKKPAHHQSVILGKWDHFYDQHVNYYSPSPGIKIPVKTNPYKNLDVLHQKIDPFTIQIKTEDVIDLPLEQHNYRSVAMPKEYKEVYRELRNEFLAHVENDVMIAENVLTENLRLAQFTGGFYVTDAGETKYLSKPSPKLNELSDILDEIGNEPVVIFSAFKPDVHLLSETIRKISPNREIMYLTGDVHQEYDWQKNRNGSEVLIANVGAGAEGVNLSRGRHAILYSLGYSATQYNQLLWRVRRHGSDLTKPVVYWHITMDGSIDDIITEALARKVSVKEELLERVRKIG